MNFGCFHQVPNGFPICSSKEERSHDMYFGTAQSLIFYFILFYCDGPIKDAHHKRGKNEPLRMPATNEYESQYIVA
jgi:hypothetical protein